MWDAQGALTQYLRALFGQKENFTVYFSRKRRSFPITIFFLGKLKEKLARKGRVNPERVYWIELTPPEHPIILLKSNKFNMAAASVKMSIVKLLHRQKFCPDPSKCKRNLKRLNFLPIFVAAFVEKEHQA